MEMTIADLVKSLEDHFAEFYAKMKRLFPFSASKELFQFMEDQCRQHARKADAISRKHIVPASLSLSALNTIQTRITQALSRGITGESDALVVLRHLADGEETLALMYRRIAEHFRGLSPDDWAVADEFDRLAVEEMEHRDSLLEAAGETRREKEEGKEG